jgi:3-oxoacyl-[acyl-carrier protein] reductase
MTTKSLQGQTAIVTGASRSDGIGAAICRCLSAAGANIFFTTWRPYDEAAYGSYDENFPEGLAVELGRNGVRAGLLETDLGDPKAVGQLLDEVESRFGAAHILINNACYCTNDSVETLSGAELDQHYAINVRAPILLSAEFVRRFAGRGARRIISMTSGQFCGPMPGTIAYASTKGALDAFTVTFAAKVGHLGITVNAVDPGPTDSGWMNEGIRAELVPRFGLGRIGLPADAANLVGFLASPQADWITGQVLHSRGGFV